MEFFSNTIRYDPSATGPEGQTSIPYFRVFGKFEMTLEDIEKQITALNAIISKTPKGERQTDSDKFVLSIIRPMKEKYMEASLLMRRELSEHV